jgi:hypothetical protein
MCHNYMMYTTVIYIMYIRYSVMFLDFKSENKFIIKKINMKIMNGISYLSMDIYLYTSVILSVTLPTYALVSGDGGVKCDAAL